MPNKQAAIKALRQTKRRTARNQKVKGSIEALIRVARKSAVAGAKDTAEKIQLAIKALDRAAQKKVIKMGNAARRKSRLMKLLKKSAKK